MKKRVAYIIITVYMALIALNVSADYFPNSFWSVNDSYSRALDSGDNNGIIEYGVKSIDIVKDLPKTDDYYNMMGSRCERVAQAYEAVGDYENAIKYYKMHIPLAQHKNWWEAVIQSQMKLIALNAELLVYTKDAAEANVFYGAKHEPKAGVLYGMTYNGDPQIGDFLYDKIKKVYPKKNSIYLMYTDFPNDDLSTYRECFKDALAHNTGVMFGVTTFNSMGDIEKYSKQVNNIISFLGKSGVKVFLRWANEMNIGPNGQSPTDYIKAFKYVANIARQYPNIAMVWSPNDTGNIDRPFESYYPGDEYVDWIGVSNYTIKYFLGEHNASDINDTYFLTGPYANPVIRLKPIMEFIKRNNIQKPVMISEGGVANYMNALKEDISDWAMPQLMRMYADIPMVYPNVKLINYFNNIMAHEHHNFAIYNNKPLQTAYKQLVDNPYYLENINDNAEFSYKELPGIYNSNTSIELYSYAYYPKLKENAITYSLDGVALGADAGLPYKTVLDINSLSLGTHSLRVTAGFGGFPVITREYAIYKDNNKTLIKLGEPVKQGANLNSIILFINRPETCVYGSNTYIDKNNREVTPIIENSRTLVPVRFVAEALKIAVDWNAAQQEITLKKDDTNIKMKLNENIITINGQTKQLEVPPKIINGRTMLPLRAFSEALGLSVDFFNNTVVIN